METVSIHELENKVKTALECRRLRLRDGFDETEANLNLIAALNDTIATATKEMTEAENRGYRHQLSLFVHMCIGRISGVLITEQVRKGVKR